MKKHKSFTLIEMLVVIFILVLLISIIVVIFQRGNFEAKQNDNRRKKEIAEIATAVEAFKADKGHYPLINWGPGIHAYEGITEFAGHSECDGTFGDNYTAYYDKHNGEPGYEFDPGTEIKFFEGKPCDDLSLQLLGLAYLPKMPNDDPDTQGYDAPNDSAPNGLWIFANLKPYLDEIPKDPLIGQNARKDYNTTDWDNRPVALGGEGGDGILYQFRYLYNSYYQCDAEAIWVGDRYWLNAITQLKENGDPDSATGLYFYELGNANWFRSPRSVCGGTIAMGGSAPQVTVQAVPDNMTLPLNTSDLTGTVTDDSGDTHTFQWTGSTGATFTGSTTARNTTVSFSAAGTYTFTLTATDNTGLTGTGSDTVTVNPAAVCSSPDSRTIWPDSDVSSPWMVYPDTTPAGQHWTVVKNDSEPGNYIIGSYGLIGQIEDFNFTTFSIPSSCNVTTVTAYFRHRQGGTSQMQYDATLLLGGNRGAKTLTPPTSGATWALVSVSWTGLTGITQANLDATRIQLNPKGSRGNFDIAAIYLVIAYS